MNYQVQEGTREGAHEVYFDGKPDAAIRDALKDLKMRWNGKKLCWYGFVSEDAIKNAIDGGGAAKTDAVKTDNGAALANIQFKYNGIKTPEKLYKCYFSNQNGYVHIYARSDSYTGLPRGLFPVWNDSDIYTDYVEEDSGKITADHPLYNAAVYAAALQEAHRLKVQINSDKKYIEHLRKRGKLYDYGTNWEEYYTEKIAGYQKRIAEIEKMKPVYITVADLEKIDQLKQEAENKRKQAQIAAENKAREEALIKRCNGMHYIKEQMEKYPLQDGTPFVHVKWSEHNAFYDWCDKSKDDPDALNLSLTAANNIFAKFDAEEAEKHRGYDKTSFCIYYNDPETGEASTYDGRYDLGDNEGGLFNHIKNFFNWFTTHNQYGGEATEEDKKNAADGLNFVNWLESFAC